MPPADSSTKRWLWYAPETSDCVPLESTAYPNTMFDGRTVPLPSWVCRGPDGGLHLSAQVQSIDVDVAELPNAQDEINWTCNYGVRVLSDGWLNTFRDLLEREPIGIGKLRLKGKIVRGWSTIHERWPPSLLATAGRRKVCPSCGHSYTVLHGREYFADPAVLDREFFVNSNGVFIREDVVQARNLRLPRGAFETSAIEFEPHLAEGYEI